MAYTDLTSLLKAIANSIRSKTSTTAAINAQDFPSKIDSIKVGITPSGTKSITSNGTYDVTNYASANVNVVASHSCTQLALGTVDVSKYNYIIFSHGGWGTDNGTGGSTTFSVSGDYSYSKTISHGNNCDRSTCGGHYTTVIDNTSKKYKTLTFSYSVSGADIWGGYSIHGII